MRSLVIFLFLYSLLKAQQIDTTTINIDGIILKEETPLKFRLEYNPQDVEIPIIEYEDIEAPYQLYISSELMKLKLNSQSILSQNFSPRDIKILFGGDNYFLNANIKNLQNKMKLELNTDFKKISVYKNSFGTYYVKSYYLLTHYTILNKLVMKNDFSYENQSIESSIRQINYDLEINKIFSDTLIFSVSPSFQYNFFEESNVNNFFFKSNLNLDFVISEKTMTNINSVLLNNDIFFNTNIVLKNYPMDDSYIGVTLGTEKSIKKFYYQTKIYKNLFNFNVTVLFKKNVFYDFMKEYFIKFPEINCKKNIKDFPEKEDLEINLGYNYRGYTINLLFNQTFYSYYPTYVFLNNKIETYFVEKLREKLLRCKMKIPFKEFSLNLEISHLILPKELLFTPILMGGVSFDGYFKRNLYFTQKFLYNSKTLIDNFNKYLDKNLVSFTELKYFFNENIALDITANLPFNNKNFIAPNVYCYSYFLCGVNLKF